MTAIRPFAPGDLDALYAISLATGPGQMAIVGACVAGGYALAGALLTGLLPEPGKVDHHD